MDYALSVDEIGLQKMLTNLPKEEDSSDTFLMPAITSYIDLESDFETDINSIALEESEATIVIPEQPEVEVMLQPFNQPQEAVVVAPEEPGIVIQEITPNTLGTEENTPAADPLGQETVNEPEPSPPIALPEPEERAQLQVPLEDNQTKAPDDSDEIVLDLDSDEETTALPNEFVPPDNEPEDEWEASVPESLQKKAISPSPIPNNSDSIQDYNNPYNVLPETPVPPPPLYMEPMNPYYNSMTELPQNQSPESVPMQPAPEAEVPESPVRSVTTLDRVCVKGFKVTGATLVSKHYLQGLIAPYAGQELTLDELNDVAYVLTNAYRCCGYPLARAYLPEQDITDGILEIAILEPVIDRILIERCGKTRLCDATIRRLLGCVARGAYIKQKTLEHALIVINDLPGIASRFSLKPGKSPGTTSLLVQIREKPLVSGAVEANNYGNVYTGRYQAGARININDLFGYGDLLSAQAFYTGQWLTSARLAFIAPVNYLGTKVGASIAYTVYTLGGVFGPLNATGQATIYSIFANHPLYLTECYSVYAYADFDYRSVKDVVQTGSSTNNEIEVLKVGFSGNSADNYRGVNAFNLGFTVGNLNFQNKGSATEPYSFGTKGAFGKFSLAMSRLQKVADCWAFYGSFVGQQATRDLDGTEQLYLGGPYAVRAYPTGEAPGDSVYIGTLELRYYLMPWMRCCNQILDEITVKGFIDGGSSHIVKANPGLPDIPKSRGLAGAGLGIDLSKCEFFTINLAWAHSIVGSPAQSNGKNSLQQFWVRVEAKF